MIDENVPLPEDPRNDMVRVAAVDAEQAVVIRALTSRLRGEETGLRLSVLPLGSGRGRRRPGRWARGPRRRISGALPDTVLGERLYEEGFLVAGRAEVLPDPPRLSLDAYCAADHALISPKGDLRGIVDEALAALGRSRT